MDSTRAESYRQMLAEKSVEDLLQMHLSILKDIEQCEQPFSKYPASWWVSFWREYWIVRDELVTRGYDVPPLQRDD